MKLLINLFLETAYNQLKSINFPIKYLLTEYKVKPFIDAVIDHVCVDNTIKSEMLRWEFTNWKRDLETIVKSSEYVYFINLDGKKIKISNPLRCNLDEYSIGCINEEGGEEVFIAAMTFMRFEVKDSTPRVDPCYTKNALPFLESSFGHELTEIGTRTLFRFERDLLKIYKEHWSSNSSSTCLAPLVSFCQSSGTGKSKIIFETIKKNLGFYLVFRLSEQTGYPQKNELSQHLSSLITSYADKFHSLDLESYNSCTIGKILNFMASIMTKYMRDLMENARTMSLDEAIECLGKRFQTNESLKLSDCLLSEQEMNELYLTHAKNENSSDSIIRVNNVVRYIKNLLTNPSICYKTFPPVEEIEKMVEDEKKFDYENISVKLKKFPFIFVFDEAELLAKQSFDFDYFGTTKKITGFQVLRRALSYIEESTKIIAITLGTKSNIVDLNPPIEDNSLRFKVRKSLPKPIVLSGNLNIFSKVFSVKNLNPHYELFKNQIFFKYLVTRGHAIWSSLPYNEIISVGQTKIKNGTSDTHDYVLALWMILTGLAANPLNVEAKTLVSSHMGYLIDLRDDLNNLIVAYPSEPILAIVAHKLIDELEGDELFSVLKKKYEAVDLNCGNLAEAFAEMIVLRAIHKSPQVATVSSNEYEKNLNEIIQLAPDLIDLWETQTHVLEDTKRSKVVRELGDLIRNHSKDLNFKAKKEELMKDLAAFSKLPDSISHQEFSFYEVHTLGGTLAQLCDVSEADLKEKCGLPSELLESIVTANHFVRLNRFYGEISSYTLPVADIRIPVKCRSIDGKILRLAASNFSGIIMEPGYYGYDFGVPYCMKDGTFGFLAVQVKRAGSNLTDDVHKMQARFHYVKCCDPKCDGKNECLYCTPREELQKIYENQVSVIISLDDDENCNQFKTKISCYFPAELLSVKAQEIGAPEELKESESLTEMRKEISQVLVGKKPLDSLIPIENTPKIDTQDFMVPLAQINTLLENNNVMLSKCIWKDQFINPGKLTVKKGKEIDFVPDGFNHFQYTFSTRGWNIFKNLFTEWPSCIKIANELLSGPRFFREKPLSAEIKRKFVQDLAFSFMDYSDELIVFRGYPSTLDELDFEDGVISKEKKEKAIPQIEEDEKAIENVEFFEESKRKLPSDDEEEFISKKASSSKKAKKQKKHH